MRTTITILALALGTLATSGQAQGDAHARAPWKPELRPFVGTAIPTGRLRDVVGTETMYGLELAAEVRPWMHFVGTASWAPAETRHVVADTDMDVFVYDVGVEVNGSQPLTRNLQFHPFWGAGAGGRTYRYDASALKDRTCLSGYVSTGMEVQLARVVGRLEARDNVFCYRSPVPGERSGTRNELAFAIGFGYHFR